MHAYMYTRGLHGHTDNESAQHILFGVGGGGEQTLTNFSCASEAGGGFEPLVFLISSPTLYQLSHPLSL